jgi:hypothetical protein
MDTPIVVCYPTREALRILNECGITEIELVKTGTGFEHQRLSADERVVCQRLVKDKVLLIVS